MALIPTAGELRDRVRVETRQSSSNIGGVVRSEWTATGVVRWARVRERVGGETALAGRLTSRQAVEICVRSDSATRDLTSDHRLVGEAGPHAGAVWSIRSVTRLGDTARWLLVTCEAGGLDDGD